MVKKAKKPVKQNPPEKPVNPPTPAPQGEDIAAIIKRADSVVIVSETRGHIEIKSIKNVNYMWQVKGLLVGALDQYLVHPISSTLRQINDGHYNLYSQLLAELKKLTGEAKPEEKAPEEGEAK